MLDDPTLAATDGSGSIPQGEGGIRLRRGDSLDRFVVIDELGRGAMGTVYAAFDTKLERQVAVKLLHAAGQGIGGLLAEAQALARINHPNVVTVHDVGEHEGRLFLAMELVRGRTLRQEQRMPGRGWRDILEHYRQAARGLAAVHAADLVHGDFKPENVMVAQDGRVLVMDFGIARPLTPQTESGEAELPSSSGSRSIEFSRIRGTPAYMAPEQFRLDAVGPLSDQFAFCVALYEGLWGERPFAGMTLAELAGAVSSGSRRPRPSKSTVPRWLEPIIDRGLCTKPKDRFESMLVLDDAFDASLRRRMKGFSLFGAAGLTVVVVAAVAMTPSRNDPCEAAADALQAQISGPELAALETRITNIEHPDAPVAAAQFDRQLDTFASEWLEANTSLCTAADVVPELIAARRNCLERQRDDLSALSRAFSDVPEFDLARASNLASALPAPKRCSELDDLDAPEATGTGVLIEAQQRLARARALHQAGLARDGVEVAEGVLSDLEGVDALRLKAIIHLWIASQRRFENRYDDALVQTRAAQADAARSGDDDLQVLAWIDRVYHTESATPQDRTQVDAQLEAAELALIRAGSPPSLRIRYLMRLAGALRSDGLPREAIAAMDEALALSKTDPPLARVLSNIYNLRAVAFIQVDDKLRAQQDFQRAHDVLEEAYGPYYPTLSQSRNNLGAVCLELGDLDCARTTLEKSNRVLEASTQPNLPSKAVVQALLATVAYRQARFEASERYARASLATVAEGDLGGNTVVLTASQQLLLALSHREDWQAGEAELQRLLAWNERHHAETAKGGDALLVAAEFLRVKGDFARALELTQRARVLREQHLEAPHVDIVITRRSEASLLVELGRLEEAEAALLVAEDGLAQLEDAPQLARAQVQMARVMLWTATGQQVQASELARTILDTLDDPQPAATELRGSAADWLREHKLQPPNPSGVVAP